MIFQVKGPMAKAGLKRVFLSLIVISFFGLPYHVMADTDGAEIDEESEEERNWELMLGGAAEWSPAYTGADDLELSPMPLIMASYSFSTWRLFVDLDKAGVEIDLGSNLLTFHAGLDGVGAEVKFLRKLPITLAAEVGKGDDRDNDDSDMLKGTPSIKNKYWYLGRFGVDLPLDIELSAEVKFSSFTAAYDEAEREDRDYFGRLWSVNANREWELSFFMFELEAGCTWMDRDYAEAMYSVFYPTANYGSYDARGGLHDAHLSVTTIAPLGEHFGLIALFEGMYLLGDAADSPITRNQLQPTISVGGFFIF